MTTTPCARASVPSAAGATEASAEAYHKPICCGHIGTQAQIVDQQAGHEEPHGHKSEAERTKTGLEEPHTLGTQQASQNEEVGIEAERDQAGQHAAQEQVEEVEAIDAVNEEIHAERSDAA